MNNSKFTQEDWDMVSAEYAKLREMAAKRCSSEEELAIVNKAFEFANEAHKNVRRRSNIPYIIHPIQVAEIVISEIGLGYKSIAAALLHDVVEDTDYTVEDICHLFGGKIASLVDGLTKIKTVLDNEDISNNLMSLQAENFKRILLTLNDDARVVLIKLADRLHNCRTIEFMPEHKRDKILSETMFIFIPLAHRLGLYSVKSEMENIWLKFKEPEAYAKVMERINSNVNLRDREIDEFIAPIERALRNDGHSFRIIKRIKTPYSIWHKMQTKHIPFEQIYDLYAVRIIYDYNGKDIEQERLLAHKIYSTLLSLYNENPSRYRNWINSPKANGYEALHCTLMSHAGIWVEVQIRSRRMDDIAEKGIAAHWSYKREGYITDSDADMNRWLARIKDVLMSNDLNNLELLDLIHSDLVSSEISVFTPKGEQRTIQAGATALDFAYMIHTHIGAKAVAAKVNMKLVPLSQPLRSGDQVEIITLENSSPKKEWLQFLKTRNARNNVISYFRERKEDIVREGRELYLKNLNLFGLKDNAEIQRKFIAYSQLADMEELFFRFGLGIIPESVFELIAKDMTTHRRFTIEGKTYVLSSCCKPIPGDPVMGVMDDEGLIHVHKKSCGLFENFAAKHGDKLVAVPWPEIYREFPVRISIKGMDRMGLLNEISHYISLNMGVNMKKLVLGTENGIFDGYIDMYVKDKDVLSRLIEGLTAIDGIQDVSRSEL